MLLLSLKVRQGSDSADPVSAATTEPAERRGFPPAFTDQRPPVTPTFKTVELCGYGQIVVSSDGDPYPGQLRAAARDTLARATESLAGAADPPDRAVAAYLGATMKSVSASAAFRSQHPKCEESPDCSKRASQETIRK